MVRSNKDFIFGELTKVKGYIDPLDSFAFLAILEGQTANRLSGGVVEIGIFFGRSFLLMKKMAAPGEKALAIDLFNIGEIRQGKSEQYWKFLEYANAVGLPMDEDMIIVGDSTRMDVDAITSRTGPVCFFSIDGGHRLEHVEADSLLARDSLAEHGVIAFDDTFNPEWPEVTAGVIDFLRANQKTHVPFCVTNKKTYVCRHDWLDTYREMIGGSPYLEKFGISDLEFLGTRCLRLHHPIGRRIAYEVMVRAGLGRQSARIYGQ